MTSHFHATSEDKLNLLKQALRVQGISEDDGPDMAQFLRDTFPEGVPIDKALQFVKEVNRGRPFLETMALTCLAMVPTPGIEPELLERLEELRQRTEQTKECFKLRFRLSVALRFLQSAEGEKEFKALEAIMVAYPVDTEPVPLSNFRDVDLEIAQWQSDLLNGKRWEPEW